jgi:hypothetical protein
MRYPRTTIFAFTFLIFTASFAFAQSAPQAIDNAFVQKQFGSSCELISGFGSMVADLNGDGVDDIVIPAHCKNPMRDDSENNYTVIDPYDTFFGYGNTRITSEFASEDPERKGYVLLIIHGVGADAWRAATPKAKFLIINLPYKEVSVKKLKIKKKKILAIYAVENGSDGMTSATFWDGKKYRYVPLGASME